MNDTWLVCGGRGFNDNAMFDSAMGGLVKAKGLPATIIQGGARGADQLARQFAKRFAINLITVDADWAHLGKKAGPIRNQKMLDEYKPALVVAFPGGRGTADMVRRSRDANIEVRSCQ